MQYFYEDNKNRAPKIIEALNEQYTSFENDLKNDITDLEEAAAKIEEIDFFVRKISQIDYRNTRDIVTLRTACKGFPSIIFSKLIYPTIISLAIESSQEFIITEQTKNNIKNTSIENLSKLQKNLQIVANYFYKHAQSTAPTFKYFKFFFNNLNNLIDAEINNKSKSQQSTFLTRKRSSSTSSHTNLLKSLPTKNPSLDLVPLEMKKQPTKTEKTFNSLTTFINSINEKDIEDRTDSKSAETNTNLFIQTK